MSKRDTELIRVDCNFASSLRNMVRNLNKDIPGLNVKQNLNRPISIPWVTKRMANNIPRAEEVIRKELKRYAD